LDKGENYVGANIEFEGAQINARPGLIITDDVSSCGVSHLEESDEEAS
jgi:hypothetical protein